MRPVRSVPNQASSQTWMDSYIRPALAELGPDLVLLAHYYMGGEVARGEDHLAAKEAAP